MGRVELEGEERGLLKERRGRVGWKYLCAECKGMLAWRAGVMV